MTKTKREFTEPADAKRLEEEIRLAADRSLSAVQRFVEPGDALRLLEAVKFDKIGRDPFDPNRPLNLIEQVNQTFTALVSVRAIEYLFDHHPEAAPFLANLGVAAGSDIESRDGSVAAEVFSATHPGSNDKLNKDIKRVGRTPAKHRYVFFYCPGDHACQLVGEVQVIPLGLQLRPNDDKDGPQAARALGQGRTRPFLALTPLSAAAQSARKPLPPNELYDAKSDRVHQEPGRARAARTARGQRRGPG